VRPEKLRQLQYDCPPAVKRHLNNGFRQESSIVVYMAILFESGIQRFDHYRYSATGIENQRVMERDKQREIKYWEE
jgi:hypothetical protein